MIRVGNGLTIFTTLVAAFILTLLPIPEWAIWLRPAWILLALIFWTAFSSHRVNVGVAWISGLCLDLLNGTLLGEHALAMTVVIYFVASIHTRFRMFSLLQQSLFVLLFVFIYQLILFCIQGFLGNLPKSWFYWSSAATSMLLWPWVFVIMHDFRRRLKAG